MGMPVKELWLRMDAEEFAWHWADYRIEPWGEERADLRVALAASVIANSTGARKKPVKPEDLMLFRDAKSPRPPQRKRMTGAQIACVLKAHLRPKVVNGNNRNS